MKFPKIFIRKIVIGAILIALSAAVTLALKEWLDTQNPEYALPILTVSCNGTPIGEKSLVRAGYEWSFFTTIERRNSPVTADGLNLEPALVGAGVPVSLTFSRAPSDVQVWRAEGLEGQDYLELSTGDPCNFSAPATAGTYVYRVRAEWTGRGYIQYFFCVTTQ